MLRNLLKLNYYSALIPKIGIANERIIVNKFCTCITKTKEAKVILPPPSSLQSDEELKWQLVASVCIIRPPVVAAELHPQEKEFKQFIELKEIKDSHKSDHELEMERILKKTQSLELDSTKSSNDNKEEMVQNEALESAEKELKEFTFAPLTTEGDKNSDMNSIYRALDRSLVLAVRQKLGTKLRWTMPQTPWVPGESLRQTCDRIVDELCEEKLKVTILSNSPCSFIKYKFPKEVRKQNGFIGAKVFFYSAHVMSFDHQSTVKVGDGVMRDMDGAKWLTKEELKQGLDKTSFNAVRPVILDDY